MYLSRMFLNPRRRGAMKLLGSPQSMHAAVMASFPPGKDEATADGRVLWRIDRVADHRAELCIVSPHRPCLAHLEEQAGWSTEDTWQTRDYLPLLDRLRAGDRYAFRLTGNPTHRATAPDGTKK